MHCPGGDEGVPDLMGDLPPIADEQGLEQSPPRGGGVFIEKGPYPLPPAITEAEEGVPFLLAYDLNLIATSAIARASL